MENREMFLHIDQVIRLLEQKYLITLTSGARQMIAIPITEALLISGDINLETMERSISKIIESMREQNVDARDMPADTRSIRSSLSVIRAYAKLFCNIPPFCGPSARE